jgi:hypothetical protein
LPAARYCLGSAEVAGQARHVFCEAEVEVKEAIGLGDQLVSFTYPGDLDRSHEQLKMAYKQINALADRALKAAYAEIDRLEPLAEKYEQIREKNRKSAKLPRGGQS